MFLAALASGALSLAAAAADLPSVDSCRMMKTAAAQAEQGMKWKRQYSSQN